jgi:hypothetical protein
MPAPFVDIVFDGPPGPEDNGRFVEVESPPGHSIRFGEWVRRAEGLWALRITAADFEAAAVAGSSCWLQSSSRWLP